MFAYIMTWTDLHADRRAVTAMEYGMIAALMAVVIVAGMATLGTGLTGTFTTIVGKLP